MQKTELLRLPFSYFIINPLPYRYSINMQSLDLFQNMLFQCSCVGEEPFYKMKKLRGVNR